MKRELTEEEKGLNFKAIKRHEDDLKLQALTKEILESEVKVLPLKLELSQITKEKELETVNSNVEYLEKQIKVLKDQIVKGVESKEE